MNVSRTSTQGLATSLLISMLLLILPALSAARDSGAQNNQENPQVTQLLSQARDKAAVLSRDADEMEALTRSDVSWQSHASMLETMKEDVNDLARITEKLEASSDSASQWQRQAIDRMMPLLKELASNTTAAINHLKQEPNRPTSGEYAEYLRQNSETARELSDMISSFVQYGQTRAKLERLEEKLEIGSGKRASR
jgi:hypothetical protein